MRLLLLASTLALAAGCLGQAPALTPPPPIDAGIAGLEGDLAFEVTSANEVHMVDVFGLDVGYGFLLSTTGMTCSQLEALDGGNPSGPYQEIFGGVSCSNGCGPPVPGDYALSTPATADQLVGFLYLAENIDGGGTSPINAQSGTVSLSYAGAQQLVGTFDVEIDDPVSGQMSELQGSFDVPYCP